MYGVEVEPKRLGVSHPPTSVLGRGPRKGKGGEKEEGAVEFQGRGLPKNEIGVTSQKKPG